MFTPSYTPPVNKLPPPPPRKSRNAKMDEKQLQCTIDYVRLDLVEQILRNLSVPVPPEKVESISQKILNMIDGVEELKQEVHEIIGEEVDMEQYLRFME